MRQQTQDLWRRTGAIGVACLLFFAGVANAYCSIDEGLPHSGSSLASIGVPGATPDTTHDEIDAECVGPDAPVQGCSNHGGKWDGAAIAPHQPSYAVLAARVTLATRPNQSLVWESVFRRFPRLLL